MSDLDAMERDSTQQTRIENLFHLIQNGSSTDIRIHAAKRVGELINHSPQYGLCILNKLRPLLFASEWKTRVSAASALEPLAIRLQNTIPPSSSSNSIMYRFAQVSLGLEPDIAPSSTNPSFLNLQSISIPTVIHQGAPFLRAGGEEYTYSIQLSAQERKIQAIRQRRILLRRVCGTGPIWNTSEDALASQIMPTLNRSHVYALHRDIETSEDAMRYKTSQIVDPPKRKAIDLIPSRAWKRKINRDISHESVFVDVMAALSADLFDAAFDSKWEVRHGAFTALRALYLKLHISANTEQQDIMDAWLQECLVRCLCVLALDQFVDCSSDTIVAPVRQICAQLFGILLGHLQDLALLHAYIKALQYLLEASSWHARHGGLLCVLYLIKAHASEAKYLVPQLIHYVSDKIKNAEVEEEDVVMLAAQILQEFSPFLKHVEAETLSSAHEALCVLLAADSQTNASSLPAFVVQTLNAWYGCLSVRNKLCVKRFPLSHVLILLHHPYSSVRAASAAFLGSMDAVPEQLESILSHTLLHILFEQETHVTQALLSAHKRIIQSHTQSPMSRDLMRAFFDTHVPILWSDESAYNLQDPMYIPRTELSESKYQAFAQGLGDLGALTHSDYLQTLLLPSLSSFSNSVRCRAFLCLLSYARHSALCPEICQRIAAFKLESSLKDTQFPALPSVFFTELKNYLSRVIRMAQCIQTYFQSANISIPLYNYSCSVSAAEISQSLALYVFSLPYDALSEDSQCFELAHYKRQELFVLDEVIQKQYTALCTRWKSLQCALYCQSLPLPPKRGLFIKALMDSIKTEEIAYYRNVSAHALTEFVHGNDGNCVNKIVRNLCHSVMSSVVIGADCVQVKGAEETLCMIFKRERSNLFSKLCVFEEMVRELWDWKEKKDFGILFAQRCHLIRFLAEDVDPTDFETLFTWLQRNLVELLRSASDSDCAFVANAIVSVCVYAPTKVQNKCMRVLYEDIFPLLPGHYGAIFVLHSFVSHRKALFMPYVPSLTHLSMQCLSSQNPKVQRLAATCFASLVPLLSLQMDLKHSNPHISHQNQISRQFLENLLTNQNIIKQNLDSIVDKNVSVREYQKSGIDWLSFLVDNHLFGILADDMGLGKTMQMLAAIALRFRKIEMQEEQRIALIVCPPIIVSHWCLEARTKFSTSFDTIIEYSGSVAARRVMRDSLSDLKRSILIAMSYSVLCSEIAQWSEQKVTFLILDEAHLIRNQMSLRFESISRLRALYRFALTGTPVQNNVSDLFSLMKILMPGYFGQYDTFCRDYVQPIARLRWKNATVKQKEEAALAITTLHDKVMPFIMRRTKDQVLKELPPKVISDILVEATAVQDKLYKRIRKMESGAESVRHVFQHLQILRKVCVHPNMAQNLIPRQKSIKHWRKSGKFLALSELLSHITESDSETVSESEILRHRCLIFAHLQETLDYAECMFQDAFESLKYERLRSSKKAFEQCVQFNEDESIFALLLTTSLGGLGLNLTGADTVIFLEHSWNPFVDLQAMDRAHRIGQKRSVRVFRLIVKDTIEEEIMNLQSFKRQVASSIVTMDSLKIQGNLLSLLSQIDTAHVSETIETTDDALQSLPKNVQSALQQLGELWDEDEYASLAYPS